MEESPQQPRARRRRRRRHRAPDVRVEIRVISAHEPGPSAAQLEATAEVETLFDAAQAEAPAAQEPPPALPIEGILAEGERRHLERRAKQLSEQEEVLKSRATDLDQRDQALERREAELEAAFGFREDRIEQRETELAEAQIRLERREQELNNYVTRLQAEFSRRS